MVNFTFWFTSVFAASALRRGVTNISAPGEACGTLLTPREVGWEAGWEVPGMENAHYSLELSDSESGADMPS